MYWSENDEKRVGGILCKLFILSRRPVPASLFSKLSTPSHRILEDMKTIIPKQGTLAPNYSYSPRVTKFSITLI